MMEVWIMNQDRDVIYKMTNEELFSAPIYNGGRLIGFNLQMDEYFLGTFDSFEEIRNEITNINNCMNDFYCVSGFSNYDDDEENFNDLIELFKMGG